MNSPKDSWWPCLARALSARMDRLAHVSDFWLSALLSDMSCSMTKDTFDNCARHEIESIDVMPTNTRTPFEELNIRPCVGMEFVSIEKMNVPANILVEKFEDEGLPTGKVVVVLNNGESSFSNRDC
ncbi:hypothetical protein JHK85_028213 [Glycine max]|nr:hypothetical protein JHK85_028213 [Glycine max]